MSLPDQLSLLSEEKLDEGDPWTHNTKSTIQNLPKPLIPGESSTLTKVPCNLPD